MMKLIRRFLSVKNRLARTSYQALLAIWALVRRWFPFPRPPTVKPGQRVGQDNESDEAVISPAAAEERNTAVICDSYVPQSAGSYSTPNLPSATSQHPITLPQRSASSMSPSAHPSIPDPDLTAPISPLGIRAVNMSAQSVGDLGLAAHRKSIIQANARPTAQGFSKRPSGISSGTPQSFFTDDRATFSSSVFRSPPAPSNTSSRAPSKAPCRPGSPHAESSLRPNRREFPVSRSSNSDESVESRISGTLLPAAVPDAGHQVSSVTSSRNSSTTDVFTDAQSEMSRASASSTELSLPNPPPGRKRRTIATSHLRRYDRDFKIPRENTINVIPPLTTVWPHGGDCGNWTPVTHPEGVLYFYDAQRRIYTDTYMYDRALRDELEACVAHLNELIAIHGKVLPPNHGLVLEIVLDDDGEIFWGYYYIDHDTRSLFWLECFWSMRLRYEVGGVSSLAHVKHLIDDEYWTHWSYFPVGPSPFPYDMPQELLGILISNAADSLTSSSSTAFYDLPTLFQMITLVEKSDFDSPAGPYAVFGLARVMSFFCHWQFINHYGQRGARLDAGKSLYGRKHQRTALITFLLPLLFWAPEAQLSDLERVWVDEVLQIVHWKKLVSKLKIEWSEFVAFASILLAANVAFLAIPAVTPQDGTPAISPAQILSNLSVASSLGSIISGLLLMRQNRGDNLGESAKFIWEHSRSWANLEPLAILQNLPYALLIWAMITYVIAFAIFCFWETELRTRIFVGIMSLFILTVILWCTLLSAPQLDSRL